MSIWHEILLGFNKFQLFMKIERSGKPHKPEKEKILSEHEITVALGQEKIPDKKIIVKKMNKSVEKEDLRKAVSHSILINKLTNATTGHEH